MGIVTNIQGQKFGRLLVIEKAPKDTTKKDRCIRWVCQCDCGNTVIVSGAKLRNGNTKSCGCLQKEIASKTRMKDLSNQKFGKLTAIKPVDKASNNHLIWLCKCDCGNETRVITDNLTRGLTSSCGCIKSKGEEKIATLLKENNISFIKQKSFEDCIFPSTQAKAFFDFYVITETISYLIEYDGEQHFLDKERGYYTTERIKDIKERDKIKNNYCKANNIILIRIPYHHYEDLNIADLIPATSKYII